MEKLVCPNCQEELEFIEKKYCCPCCEREWNKILLSSREYFDVSFISDLNTVWAQEYKILEDLLNSKQIYGIVFQIKDLYELLIRLPVLAVASFAIKQDQDVKAKDFICYLMSKPLSLGDWRFLLNASKTVLENNSAVPKEIGRVVSCVRKLVNSDRNGDIVNWRNTTIAHGATKQLNDSELYDDVASKLKELTTFFSRNRETFQSIKFVDSQGHELEGVLDDQQFGNGRLFLQVAEMQYPLYPFFDLRADGIYLFDRYIKKLQKTDIIEYIQSLKKSVDIAELNNIFIENSISNSEFSHDLASYTVEERNLCEAFLSSGEYLVPDYLVEWLEKKLEKPKDVILLKMEKGMGKSFFVRGLDSFSIDKIYIDDLCVKAFYINSTYNSRIDDFSVFVEDQMRKLIKETTLANNTYRLDINSDHPGLAFANFLNQYKKKYYSEKKLLFIFDGIDELNQQQGKSILDFIPNSDDLAEGVFVLITCRVCNEETLSLSCRQFLNNFSGEVCSFTQSNEEYLRFVKKFYDLFIIKKSRLFCKRSGIVFDVDFEETDEKFYLLKDKSILNLSLIKELMGIALKSFVEHGATTIRMDDLNFDEKLYEQYFESIKQYYGSKYYDKFINVLCCLALVDRPVTLTELAVLSGNDNVNFAFLGFINSMRLFLGTERGEAGTYFTLDHAERRQTVTRIFNQRIREIIDYLIEKIVGVSNENFDFSNIEDTVYYCTLSSILLSGYLTDDQVEILFRAILSIPAELSWSQNYFENRKELEIIKHLDDFSDFHLPLTREKKLRIAYLYANAGLDELMFNNYAPSEFYFKKAISLYEQNIDKSAMSELYEYLDCLGRFATLLWNQERNDEALEVYEKVIKYAKTVHENEPSLIGKLNLLSEYICYCNIANSAKKYDIQKKLLAYVSKEIQTCEESKLKKRTESFLNLCWFYYYRDTNQMEKSVAAIKRAIDQYSQCAREDVGMYLPDLIKCYNFLLQYAYDYNDSMIDQIQDYIDKGTADIKYIHEEKDYNDEETYLKYHLLCSLIFLRQNNLKMYLSYKKIAFSYFETLSDEKRNNAKLTEMITYYKDEEEKNCE